MNSVAVKNSFTGGEWAPSLYGRNDLAKYSTALKLMQNAVIHPHGGASNRGGTEYIAETKDSSKTSRLIPFQFSVYQSYVLEFGDLYMRAFTDSGQVVYAARTSTSFKNSTYKWTASGSGTNEYYLELAGGGDPSVSSPNYLHENASTMTAGNPGSLSAGEWGYGDNDTLGYNTIYVRLTDGADPDSKADGYVNGTYHTATVLNNSTYKWTASGSGTNEYYLELAAGGDPSLDDPEYVYLDGSSATEGTLGSLSAGEWGYGDNDTLGYSTIYVRLSTGADPDSVYTGYVEASYKFELVTTYAEADIPLLKYAQSADTMYITHPSYPPRKLTRTAHDAWTITDVVFGAAISAPTTFAASSGSAASYGVTAVNADGEESVLSTPDDGEPGATFTWDEVSDAVLYKIYKDSNNSGSYGFIGYAKTETFTEPAAGLTPNANLGPPEANSPFDAADDYPGCVAFFEQRLLFCRTNNSPQGIWGSRTGAYECMNTSEPLQDDDAYDFMLATGEVNEIRWAVPLKVLLIGTSGAEWRMTAGSNSDAVTPSSVDLKPQSKWGVSNLAPLTIGNTVLFIDRSGTAVRDLTYSYEVDGYQGNDLSILSNHLFKNYNIEDWCYQQTPDSIVWCVRSDGILLGLTYYREHEVWGWHRHVTDGEFESVACISTSEDVSGVYAIVKRTINGSVKRYIEKFKTRLPVNDNFGNDIEDAYFVDCGLSWDSPTDITGISESGGVLTITAASHGLSNGDYVDIVEVEGMTEVNDTRYRVGGVNTNTFKLEDQTPVSIRSSTYKWTASGSGTNEYYLELAAGGDPSIDDPINVYVNTAAATEGTLGSLVAGEWGYGDNDTLGYSTVYIRLSDGTDPDTKANGYIKIGVAIDGSTYTTYTENGKVRKAVSSISGLSHLEGKTVSVLADGNVVSNLSVSSGAITLPNRASRAHIGLGYDTVIETLDLDFPTKDGVAQDKIRDIKSAVLRFENTRALWVGPSSDRLTEIVFPDNANYGGAEDFFTGDKEVFINAGEYRVGRIYFKNSDPVPFTILSLIARVEYGEK